MNVKNILCPVDFSGFSEAAINYASSMAKEQGAKLHFVYVFEDSVPMTDGFAGYVPPLVNLDQEKERLEAIRPSREGVPFQSELIVGHPADVLVNYADEHQIDLIVMGTHGRTGLSRLLMGSVAEAVVRRAKCPVLTLKHYAEELQEA